MELVGSGLDMSSVLLWGEGAEAFSGPAGRATRPLNIRLSRSLLVFMRLSFDPAQTDRL